MVGNHASALLRDAAILFPAFLFVFTIRGFSRALMAKFMGDDTPKRDGFLTLNPAAHIDLLGFTILLSTLFFISWLLGDRLGVGVSRELWFLILMMGVRLSYPVQFDYRNFKKFKLGMSLTMLAGSIGSFLGAFIFMYVVTYLPVKMLSVGAYKSLSQIFVYAIHLSVFYGVIALLPLPPFDGGRILQVLLPPSRQKILSWLEQYSIFIILGLFLLPYVSDLFFGMIHFFTQSILYFLSLFVF